MKSVFIILGNGFTIDFLKKYNEFLQRVPRSYSDEFKQQLIAFHHNGKRKYDICREYNIATSLLDKWLKQAENSGSFQEKDNRT